jgi:hypothetical protein
MTIGFGPPSEPVSEEQEVRNERVGDGKRPGGGMDWPVRCAAAKVEKLSAL